jgi:lipopolysaccharide/colanic/teichoic acid biosynthesis glycosyltransferase
MSTESRRTQHFAAVAESYTIAGTKTGMETAIEVTHAGQSVPFDVKRRSADAHAHQAVAKPVRDRVHAVPVPPELTQGKRTLGRILYRGAECVFTLVVLLLASPILLLQALLIKLDSPGPALFWQRRVGQSSIRRGRQLVNRQDLIPPAGGFEPDRRYLVPETLDFVKFRTMYVDADEKFPHLYDVSFPNREAFLASYYKQEMDPRVTRVGRFLRRTTLDELPNLFLVLTGKMRLVGPRPEGPWFIPYYTPEQMLKFAVKPGVTGLPQASGRGRLPIGEQIALDLHYVRRRSVWLDLTILWRTFVGVLRQRGAF